MEGSANIGNSRALSRIAGVPKIDHDIDGGDGGTRIGAAKPPSERKMKVAPLVIILVAAFVASYLMAAAGPSLGPGISEKPRTFSVPSGPITIVSDADFASQASSRSWPGDGTASHPYSIANYSIDATGVPEAISISDTTVHFIIASCMLANATESGVLLMNVANGTLWNNTCTSNGWDNIDVISSDDVSISNNSCDSGDHGIHVFTSSSVIISGNICDGNGEGINVTSSPGTAVLENLCFSNVPRGAVIGGNGIAMLWSNHSLVMNNTCMMNQGAGIQLIKCGNTTISGNGCSMNSGGITVIWESTYWIANNTCWINSGNGITLVEVNHSTVADNTCPQNGWIGISVFGNHDTVRNNSCWGGHVGVQISGPGNCTVTGNDAQLTTGYGALINTKPGRGIYVLSSSNNVITDNLCQNTEGNAIELSDAGHNTVSRNNCSGSMMYGGSLKFPGVALYLSLSDNNTISHNACLNSISEGIALYTSANNTVSHNNCSWNKDAGIALYGSQSNKLQHNSLFGDGFLVYGTSIQNWNTHTIDTTNTVNGRPVYFWANRTSGQVPSDGGQVILANCSGVTIDGGEYRNATVGIILGFSQYVDIRNVLVSGNVLEGLLFIESTHNNVTKCGIYENPGYGVGLMDSSSHNRFWNNTFTNNNGAGSVYSGSHPQVYDNAYPNYWNTSGTPHGWGNYWSDWTGPDSDHDGIVDSPYPVGPDHYPLVGEPVVIPEFGMMPISIAMLALAVLVCALVRGRTE